MSKEYLHTVIACTAYLAMATPLHAQSETEISSYAFVQEDGALRVSGNVIHLYGIYIPPTGHTCYTFIRPMPCGTRASLALDFKIGVEFVHCIERT
ncbi:MAG TPA: hypothetical protein VM532_16205, partial [Burkholderiales bacterium]|nr:hypothetical protein [Burkholderiales bacterium]